MTGPYTSRHASQTLRRVHVRSAFTLADFTFYGEDNELIACASDLGWRAGTRLDHITVKGATETVAYSCVGVDRDREGDVTAFRYIADGLNCASYPALTLFND